MGKHHIWNPFSRTLGLREVLQFSLQKIPSPLGFPLCVNSSLNNLYKIKNGVGCRNGGRRLWAERWRKVLRREMKEAMWSYRVSRTFGLKL